MGAVLLLGDLFTVSAARGPLLCSILDLDFH